jgi:hypothetical protein
LGVPSHPGAGGRHVAEADGVAVVLEHDGGGGVGGVAGPAEVAHLGAGVDGGVEADEGEVLGLLRVEDGVGELADPLAVGVLGQGAAPQTFSRGQTGPVPMQ